MEVRVLLEGVQDADIKESGKYEVICRAMCSSVTLIKGKQNILVDTGNIGFGDNVLGALGQQGLKAEDINLVIITHNDLDHCANVGLFKNAEVIAGRALWHSTGGYVLYRKLEEIEVEGVKLISTPGHFQRHQSVVIKSHGKTYVIAGDAIKELVIRNPGLADYMSNDYIQSAKKNI
ncbi:MAG: MBL fold metallo-hydrolase [Candidatus Woesearchaeota archaeon]